MVESLHSKYIALDHSTKDEGKGMGLRGNVTAEGRMMTMVSSVMIDIKGLTELQRRAHFPVCDETVVDSRPRLHCNGKDHKRRTCPRLSRSTRMTNDVRS